MGLTDSPATAQKSASVCSGTSPGSIAGWTATVQVPAGSVKILFGFSLKDFITVCKIRCCNLGVKRYSAGSEIRELLPFPNLYPCNFEPRLQI